MNEDRVAPDVDQLAAGVVPGEDATLQVDDAQRAQRLYDLYKSSAKQAGVSLAEPKAAAPKRGTKKAPKAEAGAPTKKAASKKKKAE